jgi:hypothetical protein
MLPLAWTAATTLLEDDPLGYTFADLPLREFERRPDAAQGAVFLLRRPDQTAGECLAFAGMDSLVVSAPCKITDGQLWSYRSQQLVLAHDTSLCLDEFGPHAGNDLGVYWCHGALAPLGSAAAKRHRYNKPRHRATPPAAAQAGSTSAFCGEASRPPFARKRRRRRGSASVRLPKGTARRRWSWWPRCAARARRRPRRR